MEEKMEFKHIHTKEKKKERKNRTGTIKKQHIVRDWT